MKKLLVALCFAFGANAGLLVEPYVGYQISGFETDYTVSGTTTELAYVTNGVNLGARLGYSYLLFMAGIDYSYGTLSNDLDTGSITIEDIDATRFGIFAGVELPILARAWATYYVNANYEAGSDEYKGTGYGLGVGFTGLPFVSLNLEYRALTFDEIVGDTGTTKLPTSTYDEYTASEIFLSVSLPLDL